MAYYYSYNYDQSYYQTPCGGNYDIVPFQALGDNCSQEFSNQNLFDYEYDPTPYYATYDYDPPVNGSVVAYSVSSSTFSEPKSCYVYDPYSDAATQFRITYSVQEFNEPEFEEYDPTPYGGGYDLALTYGNPLSPSDATCYPRSSQDSSALPPKEKVEEPPAAAKPQPHIESKPATPTIDDEQQLQPSSGIGIEQSKEHDIGDTPDGSSESENGYELSEKRVPQIPSGYGLEAMDLCESLFGYWPCLARYKNGQCQEVANANEESSSCNQWKETADYLFGSSYPYGERRDGTSFYGHEGEGDDALYSSQTHCTDQSLHGKVDYVEDSLIYNFQIF